MSARLVLKAEQLGLFAGRIKGNPLNRLAVDKRGRVHWLKTGRLPAAQLKAVERHKPDEKNPEGRPYSWGGVVRSDVGPVLAYRGVRAGELRYALMEGRWASAKTFTVSAEGRTQFAAHPKSLLGAGERAMYSGTHLSDQPTYDFIVEADIAGLRFRTIARPEPEGDEVRADIGLGVGIDEPIPLDRIKRVWHHTLAAKGKSRLTRVPLNQLDAALREAEINYRQVDERELWQLDPTGERDMGLKWGELRLDLLRPRTIKAQKEAQKAWHYWPTDDLTPEQVAQKAAYDALRDKAAKFYQEDFRRAVELARRRELPLRPIPKPPKPKRRSMREAHRRLMEQQRNRLRGW